MKTWEELLSDERKRALRFADFSKRWINACVRDKRDTTSAAMAIAITEAVVRRMTVSTCSLEDVLRAIESAQPSGSVIDEIPADDTRRDVPSSKPVRHRWWR